jgi:hypothetical protein
MMRRTSQEIANVLWPRPTETGWPLPLNGETQADYDARIASLLRIWGTKPPGSMNGPAQPKAKARPAK